MIPPGLRQAAERIICFLLPFRPSVARELFPNDAMISAISEMEVRGLLQRYEPEHVEMHEFIVSAASAPHGCSMA